LNYLTTFDKKGLSLINFLAFTLRTSLESQENSAKAIFKIFLTERPVNGIERITVESMVNTFNKSNTKIN
jgi:hypothetical protein